jgi:hypothetical protein
MSLSPHITLLSIGFFLISCDTNNNTLDNPDILASAYGQELHISELTDHLKHAETASDSQFIISRHIDGWLMDKIMYKQATQKIKGNKALSTKIDAYKRSLYIYELENQILAEELDPEISAAEIDTFYAKYSNDFILKEDISRLLYVKIPKSLDNDTFSTYWKTEDLPAIKKYLSGVNTLVLIDDKQWHPHSTIRSILPEELIRKIDFKKEESYSLDVATTKYYVKILETIPANENAPVSYVEDDIKNRIMHERSKNILRNKRQEFFKQSINNKNISINTIHE